MVNAVAAYCVPSESFFVVLSASSSAHRLAEGVYMLRMLTVNFFSRRSLSSLSSVSGERK
jgi:hypothetical protein